MKPTWVVTCVYFKTAVFEFVEKEDTVVYLYKITIYQQVGMMIGGCTGPFSSDFHVLYTIVLYHVLYVLVLRRLYILQELLGVFHIHVLKV